MRKMVTDPIRPPTPPLPIDAVMAQVIAALREAGSVVVCAPTGAGKTTRVPAELARTLLRPDERVLVLEPRRVAARAAARRVAEESGTAVGRWAGYHVRFDRCADASTRVLFVTPGLLLRQLQDDPFLDGVGAVIFDEVHERGLEADVALALTRQVQRDARPDLRIVAMSATLDTELFAAFLGGCPSVQSAGRAFPVEIAYTKASAPPTARDLPERVAAAVHVALGQVAGDVLAFLPGLRSIRETVALLERVLAPDVEVFSLYGTMAPDAQDAVFRPAKQRRVVVSTNVAETSVTIPGIEAVVDSGLAKLVYHDPRRGLDRLELVRISQASAEQRAGRAGRVRPGCCLRLWSEHTQTGMAKRERPEVHRVDLSATVLQLLCWGERDVRSFGWLEAPEPSALSRAEELLVALGAVHRGAPTLFGRALARLPVHPRLGTLALVAASFGQLRDGARIAALLGEGLHGGERSDSGASSDVLAAMRAWERTEGARRGWIGRVARQLEDHVREVIDGGNEKHLPTHVQEQPPGDDAEACLRMAIWAGFPDRLARRRAPGAQRALMVGGVGVELAKQSVVREAELFVCVDVDDSQRGPRAQAVARAVSAVERDWLRGLEQTRTCVRFDDALGRLTASEQVRYRDIILSERSAPITDEGEATAVLLEAVRKQPRDMLGLERPTIAELRQRLRGLSVWMPELGIELPSDADLAELVASSLGGLRSRAEVQRLPLAAMLEGRLGHAVRVALERHTPTSVELPSGRRAPLSYDGEHSPVLAARIQELFGLAQTPTVAAGRVRVTLHLLAPNMRPQQITDDIASFWREAYPQIRRELRGRYVKHAWPEDPLGAPPTAWTKGRGRRGGA